MSRIIVFGGTTEGRIIFERLFKKNKETFLFVATDLGKDYIKSKAAQKNIFVGRLTKDEIKEKIAKLNPDFIVDATHPFALLISENIKNAVLETNEKRPHLLKIRREIEPFSGKTFSSLEEARDYLKTTSGNVLLTIGTTNLSIFTREKELKNRLFVRALDNTLSRENCEKEKISSHRCFFGEGKASYDENMENLRACSAKFMVTKNSGKEGGFSEKERACRDFGAVLLAISPKEAKGVSLEELFLILEEEK